MISKTVDEIKTNLEMNIKSQLHWKLIKGYPNKKMIMETIKSLDIKIINVIVDTKCIKIIPNERKKLLQLADCCCSALFQSLKYNDETHYKYIKDIKPKLYSKGKNLISYGLKLVPSDSEATELKKLIDFITK